MANTKVVRLTTGEEVICNVSEVEGHLKLSDPLMLIPMQEGRLTFATWLPYNADDHVHVPLDKVVFAINPVEEMVSQYKDATGQVNIATPSSKIIV